MLAIFVITQHDKNALAIIDSGIQAGIGQIINLLRRDGDIFWPFNGHHHGLFESFLRLCTGLQQQANEQQRKLAHNVSLINDAKVKITTRKCGYV